MTLNGTPAASPVNGQIPSTITINEEGVVTIVGSFRDPGVLDTETVSINWNDPGVAPQLVTAVRDRNDPTLWTFTASHEYVRDNPGGVYMPVREIAITATDKDGGTTTVDAKITIAHIEPVIDSLTLSPPRILAGDEVVLTGHITDTGLHPIADIRIDWGDGTAPSSLTSAGVTYDAATKTFTALHQYVNTGVGGLRIDLIKVTAIDDDTGFAAAQTSVRIETLPLSYDGFFNPIIPQSQLGPPVQLESPPFQFQSTVFTPIDVASGGIKVVLLAGDQGSLVQLPLKLSQLGGDDISKVEIDWGDGNKQTVDPTKNSFDVAHAFPHIVGDDEITTGSLSDGGNQVNDSDVIVRAYRKGADGQDHLTSITRYRLEFNGVPKIDKFSLNRADGTDGDIDTMSGRIQYPNLPGSVAVSVVWSDGTTSVGTVEQRNGEYWFSAVRNYNGKAPSAMVELRFISTATSKVVGFFEINPLSTTSNDPATPPQPNQRHGDAAPAQRSNRAFALNASGGSAMAKSDLALMFGAGALGVAAQPSLWLDRSLAKAIRRQQAAPAGRGPKGRPVAVTDPAWLAAPYRVSGGDLGGWHEVDDWLIASDRGAAPAIDAADWLIVRE